MSADPIDGFDGPAPVLVDGQWRSASELEGLRASLRRAPGVFETMRVVEGSARWLAAHFARMQRGAEVLGRTGFCEVTARRHVASFLRAVPAATFALRLTLGAREGSPCWVLDARPMPQTPAEGIAVAFGSPRLPLPEGSRDTAVVKSLARGDYDRALAEAHARGAQEALLFNTAGDLAEGSFSNVFLLRGEELRTPGLDRGGLAGLTRGRLLESVRREPLRLPDGRRVRVREATLTRDDLLGAEEVWLTGSLRLVLGVSRWCGPDGAWPGTARLPGNGGPGCDAARTRLLELEEAGQGSGSEGRGTPQPRRRNSR